MLFTRCDCTTLSHLCKLAMESDNSALHAAHNARGVIPISMTASTGFALLLGSGVTSKNAVSKLKWSTTRIMFVVYNVFIMCL